MSTVWEYVKGHYDGETGFVNIWCRSNAGEKKMFRISNFDPYFYIRDEESVPVNAPWIKRIEKGFVSMENEGQFNMGGSVDDAFVFGVDAILKGLRPQ